MRERRRSVFGKFKFQNSIFSEKENEKGEPMWFALSKGLLNRRNSAADLGAAAELGAFLHGEDLGFDVAVDLGLVLELASLGGDLAFHIAIDFDVAGGDIAFDDGVFTDGDLAFVRGDLALDLAIDDHVVGEADGADDFDAGGEDVGRVCHNAANEAEAGAGGNRKDSGDFMDF